MAFEGIGRKIAMNVRNKIMAKPATNPLATYQTQKAPIQTGADAAKEFLGGQTWKDPTQDPEYQKLQAERGEAISKQFGAARQRLGQQEGQVKEDISSGLERLQARVGAVGGSVERARQKALTEAGQEFAGQYESLAAQEAGAQAGLKGEDVQRRYESETMRQQTENQNRQFAAQFGLNVDQFNEMKNQFGEQMKFQYKELDENLRVSLLNATTALKKAGVDAKQINKYLGPLQAYFGEERTAGLADVAERYRAESDRSNEDRRRRLNQNLLGGIEVRGR